MQKLDSGIESDELVIGIDPGTRIGVSVFYYNKEIEQSLYLTIDGLITHIIELLANFRAKRKIVKIGNGNMAIARSIASLLNLRYCSNFDLEFVDERWTSLKIKNFNQRGKRDMLSAKYISQRDGYRQNILPLSQTG